MNKKAFLIVDPLINARFLLKRIHECGYAAIALKTFEPDEKYNYDNLGFDLLINSNHNVEDDIAKLLTLEFNLVAGFSGVTLTVPYAEKLLAALFKNPMNDPSTSLYRCNKYYMNEGLRDAQLPSVDQCVISSAQDIGAQEQEAIDFFEKHKKTGCIIKPNMGSAGSRDVGDIQTLQDLIVYFKSEKEFIFGKSDLLIQEKLTGLEFYVDVVAYDGKSIITAIGQYLYHDKSVMQGMDILDPELQDITLFTHDIVKALGIVNGLYHIEVMRTPNGLRLIEVNCRISGGFGYLNVMSLAINGVDQINAYISLLNGEYPKVTSLGVHGLLFNLRNRVGNYRLVDMSSIEKLSSFVSYVVNKHSENTYHADSVKLSDSVGFVLLLNKDANQLESDMHAIQAIEADGGMLVR